MNYIYIYIAYATFGVTLIERLIVIFNSIIPFHEELISEYTIPYVKEAIEQAKYFHSLLNLHSVGWDIAIGEDGPIFIEGNDNWEINGPQSCNKGLAKEFKEYFFQ